MVFSSNECWHKGIVSYLDQIVVVHAQVHAVCVCDTDQLSLRMSALNLSLAANTVHNSNKCFLVPCCERWKQLSLKACNDPLFICAAIDWWSNQDIACLLLYDSWDGLQPP